LNRLEKHHGLGFKNCKKTPSMDWFKGKSTGNHSFYHEIWWFPVNFPVKQSNENNIPRNLLKLLAMSRLPWHPRHESTQQPLLTSLLHTPETMGKSTINDHFQ